MIEPTSINSLPPEILTRIFYILISEPCQLDPLIFDDERPAEYSRYPGCLTQVCTLWRKIAISSRLLWCHIDLSPNSPYVDDLVARADAHLACAGELPIELHIAVDSRDAHTLEYEESYRLISLVSGRVTNLELAMQGPFRLYHRDILGLCFRHRPALTKLVLRSEAGYSNNFLVADSFDTTMTVDFWLLELDCTEEDIESCFAHITVLHLRGVFPIWSSNAYHGLVDLRLLSTGTWSDIREAELIIILQSSPGLRIVHFGLEIRDETPATQQVTLVNLPDLQFVNIFPDIDVTTRITISPGSLLRLLAPGTKPLQLSFEGFYLQDGGTLTEVERFFARSQVTQFYTRSVLPPPNLLLSYSAHLERVILDYFDSVSQDLLLLSWLNVNKSASLPRLKSLHITNSALLDHDLRVLLKYCPDGIVLDSCKVERNISRNDYCLSKFSATELLEIFPTIKVINHAVSEQEILNSNWDPC
ncbi:unnamed protein product [Rhizoctonia solani]|uniref:F-box domain-containing protein n=1 Tax=Rhizoctonia solani TaxID=456999 RepID=A0A8H2WGF9_9AGAM|nr:unnamed protein product [Rhizoctonia solani]